MSAGGLARLGVRCADPSTGMATIGVFCGALEVEQGGGSGGRGLRYEPRRRPPVKDYREELELVALALIAIQEIENEHF